MSEFHESCEGAVLLVNIVLTVIISPSLLLIKIAWDRCSKKKHESLVMRNKLSLEKISLKLKHFYWPIYIRLLKNYNIWVKYLEYTHGDLEQGTDGESGEEDIVESNNRCIFINTIKNTRCVNPIYHNSEIKMCLKHTEYKQITTLNNDYNDSMHKYFKTQLLENYKDINDLIIQYIYISEPNTKLGKLLIYYLKFAVIMIGLIETNSNLDTSRFNLKYPHKLLPMIENKVFILQKEYNNILKNYYYL
tara:strand:- start:1947 stop:2690 length:744 start_codon:yes stop_codon:yes gene_type:complete